MLELSKNKLCVPVGLLTDHCYLGEQMTRFEIQQQLQVLQITEAYRLTRYPDRSVTLLSN